MRRFLPLLTACLLFFCPSFAQPKNMAHFSARLAQSQYTGALATKFSKYSVLSLPSAAIAGVCRQARNGNAFRLNLTTNISFDIWLQPSGIVPTDYKLYVINESGIDSSRTSPNFLYKGNTAQGGSVRLAVKNGFISGSIQDDGKEYFIEPVKRYTAAAAEDEFVFYEAAAVTPGNMECGTLATAAEARVNRNARVGGGTCKTTSIFNLADYSIYQHYGNSVEAVENFLLANLNNVAGVFNNLNFDATNPTDTGADFIQFKVVATCIATCATCDFDSSINGSPISTKLYNSFFPSHGLVTPFPFIPHFWTMRPLMAGGFVSGVTFGGLCLMRHSQDNPLYLRLVAAHESGHVFGCQHDNDQNPEVNRFIMFAHASTDATRFSHLSDFGNVNYSSKQVINQAVLQPRLFIGTCTPDTCGRVKDIIVSYPSYTGPTIGWSSSGTVSINYKLTTAANYDAATQQSSNAGSVVLNNLLPCQAYEVEIKQQCGPGIFGAATLVYINTGSSQLNGITTTPMNGDRFNISANLAGYMPVPQHAVITVDHTPVTFVLDTVGRRLAINNLFADGARHRVDITDSSNKQYCSGAVYFTAPYYRDKSKALLTADFNDCGYPAGWTDSLPQLVSDNGYGIKSGSINIPNAIFKEGNIDSSCMGYTAPSFNPNEKFYFQSPPVDLTQFSNTRLHFDYNFKTFRRPLEPLTADLGVEIFNGREWKNVYKYWHTDTIKPRGSYNSVWDTLPPRQFIALDDFNSSITRIRFVISAPSAPGPYNSLLYPTVLLALDNIVIDGYPKDGSAVPYPITVYPNPTNGEIFIKSVGPAVNPNRYRILDLMGRECQSGLLINNSINCKPFAHGIYILQLSGDSGVLYTGKLIRQ